MGLSERHLRRVIAREYGVSPVALAQTQRLLLAKRLLTDTDLPVGEVAFASGFHSLRRFNALFRERYRLNPADLRRFRPSGLPPETLACEVAYRPPLDWDALLLFLVGRASSGVEALDGRRYLRTVRLGESRGWVTVEPIPDRPALRVTLSAGLATILRPTLARVRGLFDLQADPLPIAAHLGSLAQAHPGLRVPGAFDGFEMTVRAILGQQVSVRAASTLAGRFAAARAEDLVALGILATRARSILALAGAAASGEVSLEPGGDAKETMARLRSLPGIGEWTAQYVALRALAWPDAFPHRDLGIRKAMGGGTPKRLLETAERWRPWRAYAAMPLWKSLEENATG